MARRVRLPDDLFRPPDGVPEPIAGQQPARAGSVRVVRDEPAAEPVGGQVGGEVGKEASGRVKHDEKMTVYVTSAELIDLEQARLHLRGRHGLVVDRGRLVREALALVLHDLDERGADSMIVRRLAGG